MITVGFEIPRWEVPRVSAEKMKTMAALLDDSNPIHFDVDAVRALGLGDRVINQGPSNAAYLMNMLTAWTGDSSRLRSFKIRFLGNVPADSHAVATGTVTAVRDVEGHRLAECTLVLTIDHDVPAVSGTAVVDISDLEGDS